MSAAARPVPQTKAPPGDAVVPWTEAWKEECTALGLKPSEQPAALCLSGGGIRSASFSLGVLQALAEAQLLREFHYLSTVSGGGYIGGWLTRLIAAQCEVCSPVELSAVEEKLKPRSDDGLDSEEVTNLRRHTRYLAPQSGLTSLDLWAGVLLWLRNTLINWLVFVPLLLFVVSLPFAYGGGIAFLVALETEPWIAELQVVGAGLGLLLLVVVICLTILRLPTHDHPWSRKDPVAYGKSDRRIFWSIVVPIVIWCLLVPACVAPSLGLRLSAPWENSRSLATEDRAEPARGSLTVVVMTDAPAGSPSDRSKTAANRPFWVAAAAGLVILLGSLAAYGLAFLRVLNFDYGPQGSEEQKYSKDQRACFTANAVAWFFACLGSASFVCLGIYLVAGRDMRWIVIGGPVWMMLAEVLRSTFYVAFRVRALRGDLDREWLARLSGTKFVVVLSMATVAILALVVPPLVVKGVTSWLAVLGGGVASGSAAALLGKSARTALAARQADGSRRIGLDALIGPAIVLFGAGLVVAAAWLFDPLLRWVQRWHFVVGDGSAIFGKDADAGREITAGIVSLLIGGVALLAAYYLGKWINLNNFSMHAVYRNRLVRGFLGSARSRYKAPKPNEPQPVNARRPDRYTGFDPADDLRMADAFNGGNPAAVASRNPPRLLPVVNVALNATAGTDTARAERQAASFTITPFRCGSGALRLPGLNVPPGDEPPGAYAQTLTFAGKEKESGPGDEERGISLGTAVAISGAAASPNMGYHSSPLVAFVMTLFNVRLGAWLPNPGASDDKAFLKRPDPDGLGPILWDLLGRSRLTDRYIYLSDGGHFDNLALYEMLRRRCRLMVVVDAGQDAEYGYADLRIAIQNAAIDLGVRLKFPDGLAVGRNALDPFGTVAGVVYARGRGPDGEERGEEDGLILYLKPWLPEDCPTELRAFKALKASFPHESTGNQFFTESDFESYRALGAFIGRRALANYHADAPNRRALRPNEGPLDRLIHSLKRA